MNIVCELLFLTVLFGAAVSDWNERRIPDRYPALLLIPGLLAVFTDTWQQMSLLQAVSGAVSSAFPLFLSTLLVKGAFGGGDIKLMAAFPLAPFLPSVLRPQVCFHKFVQKKSET